MSVRCTSEELSTIRETSNTHDRYAVAGTLTIGHVAAEISKVCWFFLRRGGTIKCKVWTDRHRRSPLEQGGLEVACELIFVADEKLRLYLHAHIILFALVF